MDLKSERFENQVAIPKSDSRAAQISAAHSGEGGGDNQMDG